MKKAKQVRMKASANKSGLKIYHWFGLLTAFVVWLDVYFPFLRLIACMPETKCGIAMIDTKLPAMVAMLAVVALACGIWNYGRQLLSTDTSAQLYGWFLLMGIYSTTWIRATILFGNDFMEVVRSSVERTFVINNLTVTLWLGLFFFWWLVGTILVYQFSMYGIYLWRKHSIATAKV
jgi:hypothetical protein